MHFPMRYYASSQAVIDNHLTDMTPAEITAANADLSSLAQLRFHDNAGGGGFTLAGLKNSAESLLDRHKEGMNIGYHAWKFYNYLLSDCRVDPVDLFKWFAATGQQGPPLVIQAGMNGKKDAPLETGFIPSIADFIGTITFQSATDDGLISEGGTRVHHPSRDPEVIYHEMAHGLMWLLNRVPFDNRHDSVPFGRALLEGYANYLARSLAAQSDPGTGQWARASYRDGIWHQRWSVAVPAVEPPGAHAPQNHLGLRDLPVPNYYPEVETEGLAVYDVGMVWTRALWDMRTFLSLQPDVGADDKARIALADRLVMQSYRCVLGWSASFELAAEALIAAARITLSQIAGLPAARQKEIVKGMEDRFFARGILAERGIQAIGQVTSGGNTRWLAGSDSGLRVSADPKLPWNQWQPITDASAAPLPGVTGLFVHGDKSYIATELGVYQWDAASNALLAARVGGNGMAAQTPRCLAVVAGHLVAGTNYTLWRFDENQSTWKQWAAAGMKFQLAASNIMTATVTGRNFCLVAALNDVQWARVDGAGVAAPGWTSLLFMDAAGHEVNPGWITSSCVVGNTLYAATAYKGVWPVLLSRSGDVLEATAGAALPVAPTSSANDPGMGKVLRLINDGNQKLYAGTTTGLFEFNLQPPPPPAPQPAAPQWTRVAGSPSTVATVVFPIGGAVAAGTATGGLWVRLPTAGGGTQVATVDTDVA